MICRRPFRMFALLILAGLASQLAAIELTPESFAKLHSSLRPAPDELWRTIPWKIDLLDAQRVAAREKKPLFIWAMDGHPLGCT